MHAALQTTTGAQAEREASAAVMADTVVEAKRLRQEIRERLKRVGKTDAAVGKQLAQDASQPTTATALASQLDNLAHLLDQTLAHRERKVQGLARLRGLSPDDATTLRQWAGKLREAQQSRGSNGRARAAERQANLDVQDGSCLLLLGELLGALRSAARRTRKVRRPTLYRLRGYFQGHGGHDEEPAPVPAPSPD